MVSNQEEIINSIRRKEDILKKYNIVVDQDKTYYQNLNDKYSILKEYKIKIEKTQLGIEKAVSQLSNPVKKVVKYRDISISKWYHIFHWFYTSNNFLVICGRNSSQNETIVKKYLGKNDIYLHSDAPGSGSTVIINPDNQEIKPTDIEEAADFVISHSKSWGSAPDWAYWVSPDQVSKTPESGEYIQKGSFIIRGKKKTILEILRLI